MKREHTLMVLENRQLRRVATPERSKWQQARENCMMRSFIICDLHQVLLG
jgi:hypothetical protein